MQKVDEIIKCNETDKMTKDEFEEYKVKSYNESIGDLKEEDGIDCPICKNKGFINPFSFFYFATFTICCCYFVF